MNDEAHCLKCNAVVKTQPSIHEASPILDVSVATGIGKRVCGEAATNKFWTPSCAMESVSEVGQCQVSPDGRHHWRFGKCSYCHVGEGKFAKAGVMMNPGAVSGVCAAGGKCIYKFAKCIKCGRSEY
jgi:hypothetical protein